MEKMNKSVLIAFVAVLAVFLIGFASANNIADNISVNFNGRELSIGATQDVYAGEVVPITVSFDAVKTIEVENARIRVWVEDSSFTSQKFDISADSGHTQHLRLEMPNDMEDVLEQKVTLHVEIFSSNEGSDETEYNLLLKKSLTNFKILSIDYDNEVSSGDSVPVSVVIKNDGERNLQDGYILVSIEALGISKKAYLGDLVALDTDDKDNSVEKTVYLQIPDNSENGVYDMVVKVYNSKAELSAKKLIKVEGSASTQVLAAIKNQDMKAGETKTYDLIIVNSGRNVKIYNIQAVSGTNFDVSSPSVVTVGPESSITVPVTVKASNNAEVGSYTFTVNVDGQPVVFGANVTSGNASTGVVALTVVLVVVFVVLLIVLIVLLTRKEKSIEEAETSYY